MFELDVTREFSSAHSLKGYCGNCSEKHGHNWSVQVFIRSRKLDEIGIAVDFKALKRELDAILAELWRNWTTRTSIRFRRSTS